MYICIHLPSTILMPFLGNLPCALRAGYSAGNHKLCLAGTWEGVLLNVGVWEVDETNEAIYSLKGVVGCGKLRKLH
jgi:hypothetical protein